MNTSRVGEQGFRTAWHVAAAAVLGLAGPVAADFVPQDPFDNRYLELSAFAFDFIGGGTGGDGLMIQAPVLLPFAVAEEITGSAGSGSSDTEGAQVSVVSPTLITVTGHTNGQFSSVRSESGANILGQSYCEMPFIVEPPGMTVMASMSLSLGTPPDSHGRAIVQLYRHQGSILQYIFNREIDGPGSGSDAQVFNGFLTPGLYGITCLAEVTHFYGGSDDLVGVSHSNYQIIIIGNACGDTQIMTFNLPPAGVPFDVAVQVGATTITVPVHLVGSIVVKAVLDCDGQIVAVSLLSVDVSVLEPRLDFDLGGGTSGTASDLHFGADSMVGMLGPPAAVSGGCCGTLLGCMPHLTGDAEIITPDMTLPLAFDAPLGEMYGGIDFSIAPLAVAGGAGGGGEYEFSLLLNHVMPSDIGLGKLNPTLILKGAITGTTAPSCVAADLDCNGIVNTIDLGTLLSSWTIPPQRSACGGALPCPADINHDGVVNTLDLGILLSSWTL